MSEEESGLGLGLNSLFEEEDSAVLDAPVEEDVATEDQEEDHLAKVSSSLSSLTDALEEQIKNEEASGGRQRHMMPIENLHPSEFQPRRLFNLEALAELASSIRQYGVLQPLLVREDSESPGQYGIIAGERRWRAAQQASQHEVPVIVLDIDELDAYKIALIENLQRVDIDPIDEAIGYQKLLDDFGQTQEQLAEAVGRSRPHITNTTRLLALPEEVQGFVRSGKLSSGHARALITSENPTKLAEQVVKKGLSVRQTEALVKKEKEPAKAIAKKSANDTAPAKDADTIALERDMSNALGMAVSIDSKDGRSGKISVEFKSLDQLDEVLHRLAHFPGSRLSG